MNLEKARKMRNVYKNGRKTWSENTKGNIYRKAEPTNKNTSNVIAYFAFIWKKHNNHTSQMYKSTQLKLLIIDKMDTFLKK